MNSEQNKSTTDRIIEDVTDYVDMRIANAKLSVVENLSVMFASALRLMVFVVMCGVALILFSIAFVNWLGELLNSQTWAILIVGGVYLIIGVTVYLIRNIFVNRMVRIFSKMMFSPRKRYIENEEEDAQS